MAKNKHRKSGEGTLFRRKDGRWQASFIPENGKRQYVYGKNQAEALEKLRKAQEEDRKGILATGPKQKIGDYLLQWLENVHKPTVRISSYLQYRHTITHHLMPAFGNIFIQKLTPQQVQAFYAQKLREGLKPRSIAVIHAVLHNALENAVKWNLVSRNVTSLVRVPRADRHEVQPLSFENAQTLINVAKGNWLEPILVVAITTGIRRGELLGLHWNDVDLKNGVIHIQRTANKYGGYGVVENDPKTRSSRRRVMLPDVALDALKNHKLQQDKMKAQAEGTWQKQDFVFCDTHGAFISPEKLRRHFQAMLDKAGLPHMRFHDLRHSAATILLTMGVHPKIVQELLGHSTIAMTMDTYSHLLPSMQQNAIDKLNDAFNAISEPISKKTGRRAFIKTRPMFSDSIAEKVGDLDRALNALSACVVRVKGQSNTYQVDEQGFYLVSASESDELRIALVQLTIFRHGFDVISIEMKD